jgi:hypothetical protein
LRTENYELRGANEILIVGVVVFRPGARLRATDVSRYIDEHRGHFGVEPICPTLGVSASAYYRRKTGQRSERAIEDERLLARSRAVHRENYYASGSRRMRIALNRASEPVALHGRAADARARHLRGQAPRQALEDHHAGSRGASVVPTLSSATSPRSLAWRLHGLRRALHAAREVCAEANRIVRIVARD